VGDDEPGFCRERVTSADEIVVLNHQAFSLSTGAVIPVLVKAETISGDAASTATLPWTTLSTCTSPPANTATS
jgi:hypothetical protein